MSGRPDDGDGWDAVVPYPGPPSYPPPPSRDQPYQDQPYPGQPYPQPPPGYGTPPVPWQQPPGHPPAWGYPSGWGPPPPAGPVRPGTTIAAAVLAFTLALLTLVGSVYAAAFGALLTIARREEGSLHSWVPFVQLAVVIALVAGGVQVLGGRRAVLLAAAGAEVALAIWWSVLLGRIAPAQLDAGKLVLPLLFAALALVTAGLTALPSARFKFHIRPKIIFSQHGDSLLVAWMP